MSRKLNEQEELVFKAKTGLTRVPDWAWNKVLAPEDIEDFYFYRRSKEPAIVKDVDLNLVVGTAHASYNKSPWVDMVIYLHRPFVDTFAKANQDLDYPASEQLRPKYARYGNSYFIDGEGNHRTSIAKIGGRRWVKALVTDYTLDEELKEVVLCLQKHFEFANDDGFKRKTYFQLRSDTVWMSGDGEEIRAFYRYFVALPNEPEKESLVRRLFLKFEGLFDSHSQQGGKLNLRWNEGLRAAVDLRKRLIKMKSENSKNLNA